MCLGFHLALEGWGWQHCEDRAKQLCSQVEVLGWPRGAHNSQSSSRSQLWAKASTHCPAWPQPLERIFRRGQAKRVENQRGENLCCGQAEAAEGIVSVPAPLDSLGEIWAFFSFLQTISPAFGRQKAPSPHVRVFRTTIKLFYYFIILF